MKPTVDSLVSVGVPTFNRADLLEARLKGILSQTHQNIEVIISDNASFDPRVAEIASSWAEKDSRVKYVRQTQNIGASKNFSFVLEAAVGQFFIWAADDDEWDRDLLEYCFSHIGDASLIVPRIGLKYINGGRIESIALPQLSVENGVERNALNFLHNAQPSMVYGLYNRTRLSAAFEGRFNFDMWDIALLFRLILQDGVTVMQNGPQYRAGIPGDSYEIKPLGPKKTMSYRRFVTDMLFSALKAENISIWGRIKLVSATMRMCLELIVHLVEVYPKVATLGHRFLLVTRARHYAAAQLRKYLNR